MKKLRSSLLNMVLVLTLIAIVAGGILAYVNSVTAPQIEKINADNLANGIKAVMGGGELTVASDDTLKSEVAGKEKTFIVHNAVDASGNALGKAIETSENGFGGELKVLVGFDAEGTILGYTVLQHAETPGLGAKAGLWFQKDGKGNIIGKNPGQCNFTVSKDGGEVDAITASTITSRAFLLAIKNAYDQVYGNGGAAATASAAEAESEAADAVSEETEVEPAA